METAREKMRKQRKQIRNELQETNKRRAVRSPAVKNVNVNLTPGSSWRSIMPKNWKNGQKRKGAKQTIRAFLMGPDGNWNRPKFDGNRDFNLVARSGLDDFAPVESKCPEKRPVDLASSRQNRKAWPSGRPSTTPLPGRKTPLPEKTNKRIRSE